MKTLSLLSLGLALTLAAPPLFAEIDRSKPPEPGPAPKAGLPGHIERTLSNGLKVFVIESDRQPTVTFRLQVKSGATYDGPGKAGLTSFAATLLDRGTKRRTAAQFAQELDFLGARFGASADEDYTAVSASGLVKFLPKILDLFADAVLHPAFPEGELVKEKKKSISALQTEKQRPGALASKLRDRVLFGDHPYGDFTTEASVTAITREDVASFHAKHFLPNRATLAVVGAVKADAIVAQLEKAFAEWKPGTPPGQTLPEFPTLDKTGVFLVDRPGSVQSTLVVAAPGVARALPEYPELGIVNSVLGGGGMTSRLFQNLREKNGFTYGASSSFSSSLLGGAFVASSDVRNDVTKPALTELLGELRRIRSEEIPAAELEMQKQYRAGNFLLSLESPATTAARVQEIEFYGLPKDYYQTYTSRILALTPARALELAKKYLRDDQLAIVVVGEAKDIRPALESFGPIKLFNTDLQPIDARTPAPSPEAKP